MKIKSKLFDLMKLIVCVDVLVGLFAGEETIRVLAAKILFVSVIGMTILALLMEKESKDDNIDNIENKCCEG